MNSKSVSFLKYSCGESILSDNRRHVGLMKELTKLVMLRGLLRGGNYLISSLAVYKEIIDVLMNNFVFHIYYLDP